MLKRKNLDVVDIKVAIKSGELQPKVRRGSVYLENEIGECVLICELKDFGYKEWWKCLRGDTLDEGESKA